MDDAVNHAGYLDELQRLRELEGELERQLAGCRAKRAVVVRSAMDAGVPGAAVMAATGLSHARVYQLRAGRAR